MFRRVVPGRIAALLASEFLLIYSCYVAATFALLRLDAQVFLLDDNGWLRIFVVTCCLVLGIYFHDLYSNLRVQLRDLMHYAVVVAGAAFLAEALLSYLKLQQLVVPARPMIAGSGLTIVALLVWRVFFIGVLLKVMPSERVIFLGNSPIVLEITAQLENRPEKGLTALGFLDDCDSTCGKRLGALADLDEVVRHLHPGPNRCRSHGAPLQFAGGSSPPSAALRHPSRGRVEHL